MRQAIYAHLAADWLPLERDVLLLCQVHLQRQGLYAGEIGPLDAATLAALRRFAPTAGCDDTDVRDDAVSNRLYATLRQGRQE